MVYNVKVIFSCAHMDTSFTVLLQIFSVSYLSFSHYKEIWFLRVCVRFGWESWKNWYSRGWELFRRLPSWTESTWLLFLLRSVSHQIDFEQRVKLRGGKQHRRHQKGRKTLCHLYVNRITSKNIFAPTLQICQKCRRIQQLTWLIIATFGHKFGQNISLMSTKILQDWLMVMTNRAT